MIYKNLYLTLFLSIIIFSTQAQTAEERAKIVQEYNNQNAQSKNARQAAQVALNEAYNAAEIRVNAYLLKYPVLKRTFVKNGSLYYLKDVDKDGNPVYINTKSNVESGTLIKANQLYTGGTLGVNITGQNMVAGIWDGGQVRATHELLSGKVAMQAGQTLDGSADNHKGNNHQTHVTGTMVGKEIANQPSARGIAYGATALNYDWSNDKTEMAAFAASGYLISNHSYGYGNGEGDPIWRFGAYDSESLAWDVITKNAPFYLPFVAAGNEQNPTATGSDGKRFNGNWTKLGYDMITGASAAKNVMTVGAVNADKTMSNYSNWGPSDDGRVKPEIVTRGTGINSSVFANPTTNVPSDNSYSGIVDSDGTSYAAPAAAAAGLLLQQYYNSLYGSYMKAATLKALMLGTAEDLGQPGPDHKFGWGLLDVEKAARAIQAKSTAGNPTVQSYSYLRSLSRGSYIEEITYNLPPYIQTDPNRKEINRYVYAKGGEPLIISIAWTDTSGVEQTSANGIDPTTSRLVHEYDMLVRITSPFQDSRPWKPSTMANRTADATTQTNWFDGNGNNYKQIKILNPVAGGEYRIVLRKSATSPNSLMPVSIVVTGTELAAPTASAQTRCANQTVASLVATGTNIKWYDVATGGTALATTTLLTGQPYYASQTVGGTESARTAVVVTVNPMTTPSVTLNPTTACAGVATFITTTATNGGTSPTYVWNRNGNLYSNVKDITISSTTAVSGDVYTLTMTPSANACSSTPTATASITIGVGCSTPPPTASNQSRCQGQTVANLVATGQNIKWYAAATGGTALATTTVLTSGNYYASQTVGGVESTTRTAIVVTVNPTTTATVTLSSNVICSGTPISITATVSNVGSSPIYLWTKNGFSYNQTKDVSIGSDVRGGDVFLLTVTPSADACPSVASVSAPSITTSALAPAPISIPTVIICEGSNVTLGIVSKISLGANPSYAWYRNGSPVPIALTPTLSITNAVLGDTYRASVVPVAEVPTCLGTGVTPWLTVGCIRSVTSGNWEDAATWNLNRVPLTTDNAVIDNNHNVTITTDNANANKVETRSNAKLIHNSNTTKLKLGF
jgi:serine protease AprX